MAVLFVGNGINRAESISAGWEALLTKIIDEPTRDISNTLGMTLRFEYIDSISNERTVSIKKSIAETISNETSKLQGKTNTIHHRIMELPIQTVLTTNYDYALELAGDSGFLPKNNSSERLYSFRRYQQAGDIRVYHIHGECAYPNTICLGFEHYAGMLEKMRGQLVKATSSKDNLSLKFHLYDVLRGNAMPSEMWYYWFFTEDIYFLGFGFDPSEEDIWWLLCYRKKLRTEFNNLVSNRIFFLDTTPIGKKDNARGKAMRRMLSALDIDIIEMPGRTYRQKTLNAIAYVKKEIIVDCRGKN